MNNNSISQVVAVLFLVSAGCTTLSVARGLARGKVTVSVVDERGGAVSHANVIVAFGQPISMNPWDGIGNKFVEGTTDADGLFSAKAKTVRRIRIIVDKEQYYKTSQPFIFSEQKGRRWMPYNPTVLVTLRSIVNPVPMYAKTFYRVEVPAVLPDIVGYDLLMGDWVPPYGNGTDTDFVFKVQRDYKNNREFSYTFCLSVAGPGGGFSGIDDSVIHPYSALRLPRFAPETGYSVTNLIVARSYGPGRENEVTVSNPTNDFFFRMRCSFDENGSLTNAMYGKLVGPLKCTLLNTETAKIKMTYYVQPFANDRNMEFDIQRNKFGQLPHFERVKKP